MVGLEVGTTAVTSSAGSVAPIDALAPRDLLHRVSRGSPFVRLEGAGHKLRCIHEIFAEVVGDAVTALDPDGEGPIALAVPGWWSPRTLDLLAESFVRQERPILFVNDAEAAVVEARASGIDLPDSVAVVSVRASHTSIVIVSGSDGHPRAKLNPTRVLDEGAQRLDVSVLQHLLTGLRELGDSVDPSDAEVVVAARAMLEQCRSLRESLSARASESLQPSLPGIDRRVLLVRSELEEIASAWADAMIEMVQTALDETEEEVGTVLLVGGMAAMPLVSQRLSADLGLEVVVPDEPHQTAVRGAELIAARQAPVGRTAALWAGLKARAADLLHRPVLQLGGQRISDERPVLTFSHVRESETAPAGRLANR